MSTTNQKYLLLFRGKEWWKGLSPDQLAQAQTQIQAWFDRLTAAGQLTAAQPLAREGALIGGREGRVLADGPFAEAKEAIGGYLLLEVASREEAIAIARSCPALAFDTQVEVRPLAEECPMAAQARRVSAGAVAAAVAA